MNLSPFGAYPTSIQVIPGAGTATNTTFVGAASTSGTTGMPSWMILVVVVVLAMAAFGLYTQYKAYSKMSGAELADTFKTQAEANAVRDISNIL